MISFSEYRTKSAQSFFKKFRLHAVVHGTLVPQPWVEPVPPALEG